MTLHIYGNNCLGPFGAALFAASLNITMLAILGFIVREYFAARKASALAAASADALGELRAGIRFVTGTVEYAKDCAFAVQVTIQQSGSEEESEGSYSHAFTETSRKTNANPFYIKHASGKRIRVEPQGADVVLIDQLDQLHWVEKERRSIRAELTPNERVIADGELCEGHDPEANSSTTGYRESLKGWVLKPRDHRLQFSTESLARPHELRAKAFRKSFVVIAFIAAAMQVPLSPYHLRAFSGQQIQATYLRRSTWQTDSDNGPSTHYGVEFTSPLSPRLNQVEREEIDSSDYRELDDHLRASIWVQYVPGYPVATALGRGNSIALWLCAMASMMTAGAFFVAYKTHHFKRWYERKHNQKGSGRLPEPSGERFANN